MLIYGNFMSILASLPIPFLYFGHKSVTYRYGLVTGIFLLLHIGVKKRVYERFWNNINPFFEKYEIK